MTVICFTCRKRVKAVTINSKSVLYELDANKVHHCSRVSPEEAGDREDEDSSTYHRAKMKKAA